MALLKKGTLLQMKHPCATRFIETGGGGHGDWAQLLPGQTALLRTDYSGRGYFSLLYLHPVRGRADNWMNLSTFWDVVKEPDHDT